MFANVLLPIDLNHEASWTKALPAAERLMDEGGTLHILGIVPDFGASMIASYFPANFEEKALQDLHGSLSDFARDEVAEGLKSAVHVGHGHVPETILKIAKEIHADVIVMASHPPDDVRNLLIGSSAEKVVRHAETPVLVVR